MSTGEDLQVWVQTRMRRVMREKTEKTFLYSEMEKFSPDLKGQYGTTGQVLDSYSKQIGGSTSTE